MYNIGANGIYGAHTISSFIGSFFDKNNKTIEEIVFIKKDLKLSEKR